MGGLGIISYEIRWLLLGTLLLLGLVLGIEPAREAEPEGRWRAERREQNFFPRLEMPGLTINAARLPQRGQVATVLQVSLPPQGPMERFRHWRELTFGP